MNKDENSLEIKEESITITFSFINTAINNIFKDKEYYKDNNNKQNYSNIILSEDIDNLLNSIKKLDNLYNYIYKKKSNLYILLKRNIIYLNRLSANRQNKVFKEKKINKYELILAIIIINLKNYINAKKHEKIKNLLLIIIRLIDDNIFPSNIFSLISEIFLNILLLILKINSDNKYSLNDEPFIFINDIIESIIKYPKEIRIDNINNYILTEIIDIFDKILITPNYFNINFKENLIWLKFLENQMINPLKENKIINKQNKDNINEIDKNKETIQKKIHSFLTKIYKYNLKDEYFHNNILKKGIINLKYSINIFHFLIYLFNEEEKLLKDSSFKIVNGFYLQKTDFLFLSNIKLKLSEYSIIFSFKITEIPKDGENISILNIYNKPNKIILNISLDKDNYLNILYNGDKNWNTLIKIKENKDYLVCVSLFKKLLLNSKLSLFINESIEDDIIIDENNKEIKIEGCDSCYYYKKKFISIELSRDFCIELGKNNFIGYLGEFFIINKSFTKDNIHHLFNLKENYSKVLSQIYNKYENLNSYESINSKFDINNSNSNKRENQIIAFLKQFNYEIKLEIMTYKINKFTKLKYFSQNYYNKELLNNPIRGSNLKENNEINENNLSLISSFKSSNNSLDSTNAFTNTNTNYFSLSNSNSFNNSIYIYQKESSKQDIIDINFSIFNLRYSSIAFYQNKGIEFLTLQLHNIISTVEDKNLLDIYLYEIINFICEIMSTMRKYIIDKSDKKSPPKLNNKISIFFLTLLTLLKKRKETIILNDDIILKLFELLDFFRFFKLFIQRNMILSILLEVKYYKNKSDIMKYPTLLKTITSEIIDNSNKDISIINDEILYKLLMLDFIFQLDEYKHKLLMESISVFITFDKYKQSDDKELANNMINEFLNYFLGLKNEVKIYHYLKIIYFNLTIIKNKLINNEKFLESINMRMEKINTNHCKYCAYNQILYYLIYEETCFKSSSENDYCFHYSPMGFMKNPSFYFIKCIFFQCFSISNENKLKYIKNKSEDIQFILSGIKNNNNNNNKEHIDNALLELIGYKKFIPRFEAIVKYIKFLLDEQRESKDIKLLNNINKSINIIMNFLKEIWSKGKISINNLNFKNYKKTWSIINKDNINNYINESEKRSKEYYLMKKTEDFFNELFSSNGMKNFYLLYLNNNFKNAIEDIKDFIIISARYIFNPFYYFYFLPNLDFDNDINRTYLANNNVSENINEYIQFHLFNLLVTELTASKKLNFDDSQDLALFQNNILLLIYLYQNLIDHKIELNEEFQLKIIIFLDFLIENSFINSKYIFNINTILDNNLKDIPNKKFIFEMILDIYFIIYDKTNYNFRYYFLIKQLFTKNNMMEIDQKYLDNKNKDFRLKDFNQDFLCNICNGVEVPEILYTIYSLYYLCEKLNKYQNNNIEKDNSEPIKMIKELMVSLFTNVIQLYHYYSQKIIYVRKHLINRYPYKIYKNFMLFFEEKYKDKGLTLDKLIEHYYKLIAKKEIINERNTYFSNKNLLLKKISIDSENNDNDIVYENNIKKKQNENNNNNIENNYLNKFDENPLEKKSKFKKKSIDFNDIKRLRVKKRAKSYIIKISAKEITNKIYKNKSSKNINKIFRKISIEESESENYLDSSLNNSFNLNENKKKNNSNNIILIGNDYNDDEINKNVQFIKKNEIIENNLKNIEENNRILENEHPILKNNEILKDDISDISEEENIIEEYDIKKKLKKINIPAKYYRNLFHLSEPTILKILFNPKEYYFWNKFTLILKNIIFHNKKFNLLTKIYNLTFRNVDIEKSFDSNINKCYLKYPTKLKNFIADDYYRPFIKPDINFFRHKLLAKTHSYLKNIILNKNFSDDDNLCKIKFERILPVNYDLKPTKSIVCESINNNGSIYGQIYFNHAFLLFISDNNNDPRKEKSSSYTNDNQEEFYLYSYFLEERLKYKKKYILMHFSEIKEIFIRRFCFNYIGYEIFMKDNRSHLFNFFNKNNLKNFLKIMSEKLELSYKKQNVNNIPIYSHNENILSLQILNYNISNKINFNVINDPLYDFEKKGYKSKYQKGDIPNFKYLLLLNKYSSRTYKDNSQYLVFPLLFMDIDKKVKRDLSKAICLNKEINKNNEEYYKDNFKTSGNHFNTHYSTSGYILYYLVRLNPFTFGQIKLQSGKFDAPERIFNSLNNYLSAITTSEENRELIPELFFIYEAFINLNHNNIGYIKNDNILINDFNSNDKNGIIEYIITMRQALEKLNIIPWIDNIFGYNQLSENQDIINIFPLSSYEQKNNYEEKKKKLEKEGKTKKEIIRSIKSEICLLSLGISPAQIFKTNHPLKNTNSKRLGSFFDGGLNNSIYSDKNVKSLAHNNLTIFINKYMINKYHIFCITNENNNFGMKLLIKSKTNIYSLKMYNNENNNKNNNNLINKYELWKKKQIKIEPFSKMCCELSHDIFCFCRYIDNVIHIRSEKETFIYQYKCIITSLEFFSYSETKNQSNNSINCKNEILFGDEYGNLNLLQIEYEINKKQMIQIKTMKIIKEIRAHNSFIQGIIYLKRLNIIISYSEEGQITINNAYTFNIINIIELGEKYYIKNIKISDYDLMYIYCFNNINKKEYIKCYTLNGMKATKLKTEKKINNYFFANEELIVIYENNLIETFNLYDLSTPPIFYFNPDSNIKDSQNENENENNIVFCDLILKDMKLIIIYKDNNIIIQDIFV